MTKASEESWEKIKGEVNDKVSVVRLSKYDRISFVLSISKYICENPAMSNFGISQVKFDMRQLHWIIVKILYRKPKIWGRANYVEFYWIWALLS